jgi:tungstate transport system ATP-binding protein
VGEALYRLDRVTCEYAARRVLCVDSLEVRRGEILALVGPSGAGKSTLLRLLNFLESPTTGTIEFEGQPFPAGVRAPLDVRRKVTTVFQRPVLLRRNVSENVAYGLRLRGERNAASLIHEALDDVGLAELARQDARTLSGGEAQRVALARALIVRPAALLLDEPTANLDPYNVGLIERIVRRMNETLGVTIVLVTHNIFQAQRLAHRVALLLEGQVVEVAETNTFFHSPSDSRTAAFVHGELIY